MPQVVGLRELDAPGHEGADEGVAGFAHPRVGVGCSTVKEWGFKVYCSTYAKSTVPGTRIGHLKMSYWYWLDA